MQYFQATPRSSGKVPNEFLNSLVTDSGDGMFDTLESWQTVDDN